MRAITREMCRRSAVKPVIGHINYHFRMGCTDLAAPPDECIGAVLAAPGRDFRRLLGSLKCRRCQIVSLIL